MSRRVEIAAILTIFVVGSSLRLLELDAESLWLDEFHSMSLADAGGARAIIEAARLDVHPPAYFLALYGWRRIAGESLGAARLLSALFSMVALGVFWLWVRRLAGAGAACLASVLMALSPYQLWYAQEARMYSLLVLAEVCVLWSLARLLDTQGKVTMHAVALFAATALIIQTHFFFIFVLAFVLTGWLLALARRARSEPIGADTAVVVGWVLWSAAWAAPGLLQMANRIGSGEGIDWLPPLSADTFTGILRAFGYGVYLPAKPSWLIWPGVMVLACALIAGLAPGSRRASNGARSRSLGPDRARLWAGGLLVCTLALPVVASLVRPLLYYGQRYLIIATVPFYLAIGLGLQRLASRCRGAIAIGGLAILLGTMVRYHVDYFDSRQKRSWDRTAEEIDSLWREGDSVLVVPNQSSGVLDYYLEAEPTWLRTEADVATRLTAGSGARVWFVDFAEAPRTAEKRATAGAIHRRTVISESGDLPGMLLRWTLYEARATEVTVD